MAWGRGAQDKGPGNVATLLRWVIATAVWDRAGWLLVRGKSGMSRKYNL